MALTIQSAIDLARLDLNDSDPNDTKRRWDQATLLKHANSALLVLVNRAPHLWTGKYSKLPNGELAATDPWPISEQYLRVCADIICAFAQTVDDEEVSAARVSSLIERAMSMTTA